MFFFGERKNRKKDYFKVINLCFLCVPKKDFLNHQNSLSFFLGTGLGGAITVIQIKVLRFLTL